jgi:hypothetical protein
MVVSHALDPTKSCSAAQSLVPMVIANGTWVPLAHLTVKDRAQSHTALSQLRPKAARADRRLFAVPEFPVSASIYWRMCCSLTWSDR